MDAYEILNQLGDGTFGCVVKAFHRKTGQIVAVKRMKQKYYSWEECVKLPEVSVVRRIQGHPNIVKMREVIREKNELFFIFEYMDGDLLGVIRKAKQMQNHTMASIGPALGYPKIKSYTFQILQSLAYLHRQGYFHRDMKPENLLIKRDPSSTPQEVIKLADFGLVKEVRGRPPFTDYVSTRWYRAPELLLQDRAYNSPVDIWAVGCIIAELITTRPLFAGSNEVDQLQKIMAVLGSPNEQTWPEGMILAKKIRYSFPVIKGIGLECVLPPHLPPQALDLMRQMLSYDPKKRPTAQQCLQHPYFNVGVDEENFLPRAAAKQVANAAKKHIPGPQSAPPGNANATTTGNVKRTPLVATTAVPKVSGPPLSPPLQNFCPKGPTAKPSAAAAAAAAAGADADAGAGGSAGKKVHHHLTTSKPVPTETPLSLDTAKSAPRDAVPPFPAKKATSGALACGDTDCVDLEGLMDEFAGELKTLGLLPQQRQKTYSAVGEKKEDATTTQDAGVAKKMVGMKESSATPKDADYLTTLLSSTRYKQSSFRDGKGGAAPLQPLGTAPLHSRDPLPLQNPTTVGGGQHVVLPPTKALLAKYRDGKTLRSFK